MSAPPKPDLLEKGGVVVFAYSDVGVECLTELIARHEKIRVVFTHRDDPNEARWFRSVAELAMGAGIPVRYDEPKRDSDAARLIESLAPDLIFSFYYRRMIPMPVLAHARRGAFNMHGSLLPRYRGKAPVNWAVLNGERDTGVTLHHMAGRADAGDIVDQEKVEIGPDDTAYEVMRRVVLASRRVLARQFDALKAGTAPRTPQNESQATYFGGRGPEDGRIDWAQPAARIVNLVRAVAPPYPGAFTGLKGRRLMVWVARAVNPPASGRQAVPGTVLSVQPTVVAAGEGAVELIARRWKDGDEAAPDLNPGDFLG